MVKGIKMQVPRQFEIILGISLQGFCPWTLLERCLQGIPRPPPAFLGSLTMFIKSHWEKSLHPYRHPNSNLISYIFYLKLLL